MAAPGPATMNARLLFKGSRRDKPQLSCNLCRKRKLRCDRKQPCDTCIRLKQAPSCTYPPYQQAHLEPKPSPASSLQQRIDQLESLVSSLRGKLVDDTASTSNASNSPQMPYSDHDRLSDNFGRIHLRQSESTYVEGDHWVAILDGIAELREHLADEGLSVESSNEDSTELPGPDLFLAHTSPSTRADILAALPRRSVLDNIVAAYFRGMDTAFSLILHRHVFFKQYESFWENPHDTPIMWIALLFAMMYFVAYTKLFASEGLILDQESVFQHQQTIRTSRENMVQCLKLGNFMKGTPHTIEAMMFYLQMEYLRSEDAQMGYWMMLGIIIRVAMKMGYHRDGSHFPEMPAYDAEMRRRIWCMIVQFDVMSSSQIGLPRMIKQAQCDTMEPRNLTDEDFDDTTVTLPPPRPESDHTLTQFVIYKTKISAVFGNICDFTTSSHQKDYREALMLDKLLNDTYALKPPALAVKPISKSIMDTKDMITRRIWLALVYHKAQIVLHRKYMLPAKLNSRYEPSHTICINASLEFLRHQSELHDHFQPGALFHGERWKILSLAKSEFLFAATVLCLDLNYDVTTARWKNLTSASLEECKRIIAALQRSYNIWLLQQDGSKEAKRAVQALAVVLGKAEASGMLAATGLLPALPLSSQSTSATTQLSSPLPATVLGDLSSARVMPPYAAGFGPPVPHTPLQSSSSSPSILSVGESLPASEPSFVDLQVDDTHMSCENAFTDLFDLDEYWKSFQQAGTFDDFLNLPTTSGSYFSGDLNM